MAVTERFATAVGVGMIPIRREMRSANRPLERVVSRRAALFFIRILWQTIRQWKRDDSQERAGVDQSARILFGVPRQ